MNRRRASALRHLNSSDLVHILTAVKTGEVFGFLIRVCHLVLSGSYVTAGDRRDMILRVVLGRHLLLRVGKQCLQGTLGLPGRVEDPLVIGQRAANTILRHLLHLNRRLLHIEVHVKSYIRSVIIWLGRLWRFRMAAAMVLCATFYRSFGGRFGHLGLYSEVVERSQLGLT